VKFTYFLKQKKVENTEKTVHLGGGPWKHFFVQKIKVPPQTNGPLFFLFFLFFDDIYTFRILRAQGERLSPRESANFFFFLASYLTKMLFLIEGIFN
jgi:hypothetical protein